ncbi:MAG: hypothetical protein ACE5GW_07360, partial [Planctomycetota bacterium]
PHLEEMRRWLSGYWQERGAPAAFPGAEGEWDRRARRLRLRYDFSGEEALADWRGARRSSLLEQRQGAMHVRGSVWLAPGGTTGIFEGDLRVIAEMLPLQLAAPNLNLVLWAREPADSRAGLLFGLGFKPPKLASMMRDETQVLLPANVIGPLVMAEGGITRALGYLRVVPRIERREVVRLEVASDARGSTLRWNDRIRQRSAPYPNGLRRGTVEIRTYTSSVLVRTMEIEGRVRAGWWGRWVKKRIASELPGP